MSTSVQLVKAAAFEVTTVKICEAEVPPPGPGVVTTTAKVPDVLKSAAVSSIASCADETNIVVRARPLKYTCELATKDEPLMTRRKGCACMVTIVGEMVDSTGSGLLTVKPCEVDVPTPGLLTVTESVPAVARFVAGMIAVSCVAETYVVLMAVPLTRTCELAVKKVPVSVMVVAAEPTSVEVGEMDVSVGAGFEMVNDSRLLIPPPGVAF